MINLIKTVIYEPLYNFLIFIISSTHIDAGLAAVILTILVKIVLFPMAKKASLAQLKMKEHEKELKDIRKNTKIVRHRLSKQWSFIKLTR